MDDNTFTRHITLLIYFFSICGVYLPFVTNFGGIYMLIVAFSLIVLNGRDLLYKSIPTIMLWGGAAVLLFLSGRWGEHNFNSPYMNYSKYISFLFAIAMALTIKELEDRDRRIILFFTIAIMILTCVLSIFYSITHGNISIRNVLMDRNILVCSWNQIVGMSIFLMIVFGFCLYNRLYNKPIWICSLLIIFYFLIVASLATSLIVGFIGCCVFALLLLYQENSQKAIRLILLFTIVLVILRSFAQPISDYLVSLLDPNDELLSGRLINVIDSIFGTEHNTTYSYDDRASLAMYSLKSFYKNPLFGVGYSRYGFGVVGGHFEWYDTLAVFGLCGTFIIMMIVLYYIKIIYQNIDTEIDAICFISALVQFVILGFNNPCFSAQVLICVFVVAPNLSCLCNIISYSINEEDFDIV